jgi:V/A-type H+-transporting ATPase subunit I
MLTPLPMQRISIQCLDSDLPRCAMALAQFAAFQPDEPDLASEQLAREELPDKIGKSYHELCMNAYMRLEKIQNHYQLATPTLRADTATPITEQELATLDTRLQSIWEKCSQAQEAIFEHREQLKHVEHLLKTLEEFAALDLDLSLLQRNGGFLDVRVGTVPQPNAKRLGESLVLASGLLTKFLEDGEHTHAVVLASAENRREIDDLLRSADWHGMDIPAELKGHPQKVRETLEQRRAALLKQLATWDVERQRQAASEELKQQFNLAYQTIVLASPYATLSTWVRRRGQLCILSGWTPLRAVGRLRHALNEAIGERFVITARSPESNERQHVPSLTQHPAWLRPCFLFVLKKGVQPDWEIDPTILFSLSFIAMFGMMFGDVGHGGVILLAGILFRQRLRQFSAFIIAIGAASVVFGFLYGSIFGFETLLAPLWMSPLDDPILMLKLALAWGVTFILIALILTIRNRIVDGDIKKALLHGSGLAGSLMYLGMLFAGYQLAETGQLNRLAQGALVIPLSVVLGFIWWQNRQLTYGERGLVVVVEGFETVMSYISNTLSFLRVAAFSLNHVALAVAVFTLAGMMATAGYWITVVLGNVFILVLEGAIVAIQVLRLEYYEGFSRFFSGDGREFKPVTLGAPAGSGYMKPI